VAEIRLDLLTEAELNTNEESRLMRPALFCLRNEFLTLWR